MIRFLFYTLILFSVNILYGQQLDDESLSVVNSSYDELNPVISKDGTTLFFTVANHPANIGGKKDPGDIWISKLIGTKWSSPVHAGNVINDKGYNAVAGISDDGSSLFLLSHYDGSGNLAKTQGISVSVNKGNAWSQPHNIFIPYFLNKSRIQCGSISADKKVFVFSAETYGTHGVDDIYVSFFDNGKWSEAKNLGSVINTQYQELSPSLSADGKTLYFSSNGLKGTGSFDIFKSTRLDETWTNWSKPENIGATINSGGRELFYNDYPTLGFALYTSTTNSDGYGDIKINKYKDVTKQDVPLAQSTPVLDTGSDVSIKTPKADIATPPTSSNDGIVKVYGRVTNSKTGAVVEANIMFAGPALQGKAAVASSANGYSVEISSADIYSIKIEAPGYVSSLEKLDIHTYEMKELEMNFTLQPVEVGTTVNLKNVLFEQSKTNLLPESFDELDLVVSFLKANPSVNIELAGHTDGRGVHADNVRLSQMRVNKVKDYLVSKGIDAKRINGKGYGGTKPIASNDSEETRRMNRRVEFTIKKM
ncbi:OmpA family protein [Chryseosolibacter indicus]|uniref:OmpA family protein n=1 Tax=Chryseosolibacter indicus TaxID=2782351 RepID=A0ABS5VLW8_9BACT|nr:OmpA family protein [Chryseosolibacter indicus]MBT1701849.1 OmpA family protein [Chryseosolibacter indicus]